MQFVVERDRLLKELGRVTGVIEARNTIPVLKNVHIDACPTVLLLRATDLDIEVETPCAAEVMVQGRTTVDGKLLQDFVKRCPDGSQIAFTLDSAAGVMRLVNGRARSVLPVLPADEHPTLEIASPADAVPFLLGAKEFGALIGAVSFAMSTNDGDPQLSGIYLHQEGDTLSAAASNRTVLSVRHMPLPEAAKGVQGVILSRKLAGELARLMPNEGEIALEISSQRIVATLGDLRLVSRLVAGTYPPYQRVIPIDPPHAAIVDRERLLSALDRVGIVNDAKTRGVQMIIAKGEIRLAARGMGRGNCFDAVEALCDAPETSVALDRLALMDVLRTSEAARIRIGFTDANAAMLFRADDDPDGTHRMVQMPMTGVVATEEREAA